MTNKTTHDSCLLMQYKLIIVGSTIKYENLQEDTKTCSQVASTITDNVIGSILKYENIKQRMGTSYGIGPVMILLVLLLLLLVLRAR